MIKKGGRDAGRLFVFDLFYDIATIVEESTNKFSKEVRMTAIWIGIIVLVVAFTLIVLFKRKVATNCERFDNDFAGDSHFQMVNYNQMDLDRMRKESKRLKKGYK